MIIKICGLNDDANLLDISKLNPDMVGYNFYPNSSRYVTHPLPKINATINKVGVFVNENPEVIESKAKQYGLDYIQLHGDESAFITEKIKQKHKVIKVFRFNDDFDSKAMDDFLFCDFFLFDTFTNKYGGSGVKFEWNRLDDFEIKRPFLLSGGIGPDDIKSIQMIENDMFYGVDINSKFETSPGVKDVEMVSNFVHKLRLKSQ